MSMRFNDTSRWLAALSLAAAVAIPFGSISASAKDSRDGAAEVKTVTVTVDSQRSLSASDFAVFKGKTKLEVVDVKAAAEAPANVAVLVQEGLDQGVGHELDTVKDFIKSLPAGSRVMVGYLRGTGLSVRQGFTTDLAEAARAVRLPVSTLEVGSAPFLGVSEALRTFDGLTGRNQVVVISSGLELNRDLSSAAPGQNVDLERTISQAQRRGVPVWAIYANAAGALGRSGLLISYGQSALGQLAKETGGRAFFAGRGFVTFDHAFDQIERGMRNQYVVAYRGDARGDLDVTVEAPGVKVRHAK